MKLLYFIPLLAQTLMAQQKVAKVGILHSQTGTLSISEKTVIQTELMAIEEINARGGLLGHLLEAVVFDGQSDNDVFAEGARLLTADPDIKVTFGCWTSGSRKAVKEIFEEAKKFLFYPVQYEGQECSKFIIYSGAAPNQQIEPAVRYLLETYPGKPMFLVGSDYVFPRTANKIIKSMLFYLGGVNSGERYVPLPANAAVSLENALELELILDEIQANMPDGGTIFNTLNGDANVDFFTKMQERGMTAEMYPVMSVSIAETEIADIGVSLLQGHLASWNYFMTDPSLPAVTNYDHISNEWIQRYWEFNGNDTSLVLNDPMEAGYINVHVWALAVEQAQSFDVDKLSIAAVGTAFDAPEGVVTLQKNHHFSKYAKIGRVNAKGLFDVIYAPTSSVFPIPWNQWIPETNGYECNHLLDTEDAGFFKPPQVKIALLYVKEKSQILTAQLLAIEQINNDQLLGRLIVPVIINLDTWTDDFIKDSLKDFTGIAAGYSKNTMEDAIELMGPIFSTSLSATFWKKWNTLSADILAQASTKPLMYVPPTVSPPSCSENIIFFGPTATQRMKPLELYLQSHSIDALIVLQFEENHYSAESAEFAESLCSDSITCLGSVKLSSDTDAAGLDAIINTVSVSGHSRIAIVNLIPGSSGNIPILFDKIKALNAKILETNQRYFVISTMVDEAQLLPSMQGHHAVSSYFKDVNSPTNFAFKSIFAGRNGEGFILTEETEKAYSAILSWASSVEIADSFDHVRARVSGYNVSFLTPAGDVSISESNMLNQIVYFSSVTLLGSSLFYRTSENAVYLQSYAVPEVSEEDACYFGPLISHPESFDAVRLPALVLLALMDMFLVFGMVVLFIHRSTALISGVGHWNMQFVCIGLILNSVFLFARVPATPNMAICSVVSIFSITGFYVIFAALLYRAYKLSQMAGIQTKSKAIVTPEAGDGKDTKTRIVFAVVGIACVILAIVSAAIMEPPTLHTVVLEQGVREFEYLSCTRGIAEMIFIGIEAVILFAGVYMAFKIKDVETPLNEALHLGIAIYIWIFVKVLIEVFEAFIEMESAASFSLTVYGELLTSIHTAISVLGSLLYMLFKGKGNDKDLLKISSENISDMAASKKVVEKSALEEV